jgi:hypothetical protein
MQSSVIQTLCVAQFLTRLLQVETVVVSTRTFHWDILLLCPIQIRRISDGMLAASYGATFGRCHQLSRQTDSSGSLMVSKNTHTRRKSVLDITAKHNIYVESSHQLCLTSMNM